MLVVAFALLLPMPACGWLVDAVFASIDADGDGIDENIDCNDSNPEVGAEEEHQDADGDSYGDPAVSRTAQACTAAPGWVMNSDDCDDTDNTRYVLQTWYYDGDHDGWGDGEAPEQCASDKLYASVDGDCDDGRGEVYPGASTECDEGEDEPIDHDCDGLGECPAPQGSMSTADGEIRYTGSGDSQLGTSLMAVYDWSGDGVSELALGAPGLSDGGEAPGGVVVVLSPFNSDWSLEASEGAVILLVGEEDGDEAGAALGAGDMDGDGTADLLVGAPGAGSSAVGGWGFGPGDGGVGDGVGDGGWDIDLGPTGYTYIAAGPFVAGTVDLGDFRSTALKGSDGGGRLGQAVSFAGDVDEDGYGDAVLGAPYLDASDSSESGAVYLVPGPIVRGGSLGSAVGAVELTGRYHHDQLGSVVIGQVSILGDGPTTTVVSAPTDGQEGDRSISDEGVGCVYLLDALGTGDGGVYDQAQLSLCGAVGEGFGLSLGAADIDGDGHDELIIGAPYADMDAGVDAGAAYIYDGETLSEAASDTPGGQWTGGPTGEVLGASAGDGLGTSLAGLGDADGVDYEDLGIGAPGENGSRGAAYVFYQPIIGTMDADEADFVVQGHFSPLRAGIGIGSAGDINGLGSPDILVSGVEPTSEESTSPGGVFLFLTDGL